LFLVMDARAVRKSYKRKWISAARSIKYLKTSENAVQCDGDSDSSGSELDTDRGCSRPSSSREASANTASDVNATTDDDDNVDSDETPAPSTSADQQTCGDDTSFISFLRDATSSSDSDSDAELLNDTDLKQGLVTWVNDCNIKHCHVDKLLHVLRQAGHKLPSTATTLMKTVKDVAVSVKSGMEYVDLGVSKQLRLSLGRVPCEQRQLLTELRIALNVDGLPLFKSSSTCFWPVLCAVQNVTPVDVFPVALACGSGKPSNLDFLSDVIVDLKHILTTGLEVDNKLLPVRLTCIVCDAPARALVKATKLYSGYDGCDKCVQSGEWRGRMTYPQVECDLRTDANFRSQVCANHHNGVSPFCELPIDMVKTFALDYMHLCCLGVMRKLLLAWMRGKRETRMSSVQIREVNKRLVIIKSFIPHIFSRLPRSLDEVDRWKATEFRLFLLYTGKFVLRGILQQQLYEHFLAFSVALCVLVSPSLAAEHREYAHELLLYFVDTCKELYGEEFLVYNVHALTHVAGEAEEFGCLDACSSFPFENYLQRLKKLVRSGRKPLAQVVKRLSELQSDAGSSGASGAAVRRVKNSAYIVDNSFCCEVLPDTENNSGSVLCRAYRKTRPFFATPCDSRLVRTYLTDVRDATVEAISATRLTTQAIMIKIGSGFDACFMAILHEL